MLYMDSGTDLIEGGSAASKAYEDNYRRDKYHQPADEYDAATWNFAGIAADVTALYQVGMQLANSRAWPNYRATSEFRPIRDKSASARH